jgi:subtilisin family serine protease
MKKTKFLRDCKTVCSAVLACVLLVGSVIVPAMFVGNTSASASGNNGYINKNNSLKFDYTDYLDDSVMFKLPDHIGDNDEISVIVTVDTANVMDIYEKGDKAQSLSTLASDSKLMSEIKSNVSDEKAKVLKALRSNNVSFKEGEEYCTVLSGFELLIKAKDFKNVCLSLDKGMDVIVGEVYKPAQTELVENEVNVFDTGIFDSSDAGFDGSGIVVAVLDTGLDSNHTAFSPDNFTSEDSSNIFCAAALSGLYFENTSDSLRPSAIAVLLS